MLSFDRQICTDFAAASSREWLETNGIGGFASGTISGANTRRYHGLLTAATRPPLGRVTVLSKFEETLEINGRSFELSTNQYSGGVNPEGYRLLNSFRLDPFPIWTFVIEEFAIEKRVFMVHGSNATVCRWSISKGSPGADVALVLKPLLSFVDYHGLQHQSPDVGFKYETSGNVVSVTANEQMPSLHIHHNGKDIEKTGYWYNSFAYAIEKERGFDFTEDLFQPFAMRFDLSNDDATLIATTDENTDFDQAVLETAEIERRKALIGKAAPRNDFEKHLVLAADQFIVARGTGQTVIAGYPWFSDWGRDTMISLPGLTLATGRPEIARNILLEFSNHISEGMLPNRFPRRRRRGRIQYRGCDAMVF